jgi:hypothetical protein
MFQDLRLEREDGSVLPRAKRVNDCLTNEESTCHANHNSDHGSTDIDAASLSSDTANS